MASMEPNNIVMEQEGSSDSSRLQAGISPLHAWLEYVFTKYLSGQTLEFMKFTLRTEVSVASLERTTCLLELFLLIKDLYGGNETAALSRLVYTLNLMGHKRFGKKAVRELSSYGLTKPPEHDPRGDPRKAQLYQCLAEIGCRLTDQEEYQIRRFCARALGINLRARSMISIIPLMVMLLNEQKITEENQIDLAYALTTIGADHCIDYLIVYRRRNGLPTQAYKDLKNPDFKSTSSSSKTFTTNRSSIQADSPTPTHEGYVTAEEYEDPPTVHVGRERVDHWVNSIPEQLEGHTDTADMHTPLLPPGPAQGEPVGCGLCVLVISLAVLAVVLVVGIAGSVYGTLNAATHQYSHQSHLVYGNSTVPLVDNLLPYYLSAVDLTQIDEQNLHVIDLYLLDSPCSQLNTTNTTTRTTMLDQPHIQNITGRYLLPGTTIEYYICALTNVSRIEHEVIVEAYVLDSLEAVWDLVQEPSSSINGVRLAEEFSCYENDSAPCLCWSVSYRVERESYYSLRFTINNPLLSHSMTYNYTTSITSLTYSTPSHVPTLHRCRLTDMDINAQCTFLFNDSTEHLPWTMNKGACLLANVHVLDVLPKEWTVEKMFSKVDLSFTAYRTNWLVVSAAVLAVLTLGLLVVGGAEVWVWHRIQKRCLRK